MERVADFANSRRLRKEKKSALLLQTPPVDRLQSNLYGVFVFFALFEFFLLPLASNRGWQSGSDSYHEVRSECSNNNK